MKLKIRNEGEEKTLTLWLEKDDKDILVCSNNGTREFRIKPNKSWRKVGCGNLDNEEK